MNRWLRLSRILMVTAALALVASIAQAQSLNLSWTDCGTNGTLNRTFACTTNGTVGSIIGSVDPGPGAGQVNGEESVMTVQTNQATLSQWWHMEIASTVDPIHPAGCRVGGAAFSMDFTAASGLCSDPWIGAGFGGLDVQPQFDGANRVRIRTAGAVATPVALDAGTEYYIWKVTLLGLKSTGTGSCAGCSDGACLVFNQQKLTQPLGVGDIIITTLKDREYVTYQTGGASITGGCPAATPAQARTWGSVKSLYR